MSGVATTKDWRVGRSITDVLEAEALRQTLVATDPNTVMLPRDELDDLAQRAFALAIVTSVSYSKKRRTYQITVKDSARGHETMHLPEKIVRREPR